MAQLRFGRLTVRIQFERQPPQASYDSRRIVGWSLLASTVLHLLFVPLLLALFALPFLPMFAARKPDTEIVTVSSAIRIERRSKPQPARVARQPVRRSQQVAREQVVHAIEPRHEIQRAAVPRELAMSRPRATPEAQQQQQHINARELEREKQAFEKTIAEARAQSDPVTSAARPVADAAASRRTTLNIEGAPGEVRYGEGVLTPVKRWTDGPFVYYYVRYSVIYPDGATEDGIVPWPIHFALTDDPFARGIRHMPLPGPSDDYTATTTGDMQPLIKNCYDHRYMYCPIARENAG